MTRNVITVGDGTTCRQWAANDDVRFMLGGWVDGLPMHAFV